MPNITKLSEIIAQHGLNLATLARDTGISRTTFYRKLKAGGETFQLWEVAAIAKRLGLTKQETCDIFLP